MATKSGGKAAPRAKRRSQLTAPTAKKFLATYREAWENRNAELAASLFTRDAHYWETPFGEPIVGREGIFAYWKAATDTQNDIHFSVRQFFQARYSLLAEWSCTYTHRPSGERRELAGMLLAEFYGKQVRTFREYWHRRVV
ncbi:MAG: nuclear transport factor 2 family protein [Acidobacteria bacterium]|nr:nuclear transport factor 2 family protein [Acidobacteriota bacterium]